MVDKSAAPGFYYPATRRQRGPSRSTGSGSGTIIPGGSQVSAEFDRRSFFKLFGLGAGAGLLPACTDAPVQHLYAYLTPPEEIVPGQATWYASVCRQCPAGCGLHVRTREARPVKLEGNPECPISRGALCPRGQAALNGLYNPDRPLQARAGKPGHTQPVTPDEALDFAARRLGTGGGKPVALLTGLQTGSSAALCARFAERLGGPWVAWEPLQPSGLRRAAKVLFGRDAVPRFALDRADFVLDLGSGALESWLSPVAHARQLTRVHAFAGERPAPFVSIAPRRDLTAANADDWLSVRPGSQGALALGLARHLLDAGRGGQLAAADRARLSAWLQPHGLAQAAERAGCDRARLQRLADKLARAEHPLALPPGEHLLGERAAAEQAAVLVLDLVLGAIDRSVLFDAQQGWNTLQPAGELAALLERARSGALGGVIIAGANPVYDWPDSAAVERALAGLELVVRIADLPAETDAAAGLLLPANHFLESWGDVRSRADWLGVQQPVRSAAGDCRQLEDWLIALAARLGRALPWADFRQCLAQQWAGLQQRLAPASSSKRFFESALANGGLRIPQRDQDKNSAPATETPESTDGSAAPEASDAAAEAKAVLRAERLEPLEPAAAPAEPWLLVYPSIRLYDGRTAAFPWIQELPDSLTQTVWDTPLELSAALAAKLGLSSGDRIALSGAGGRIEATARVLPGMRDDLVAMPLGGGRRGAGRYADGRGARASSLLAPRLAAGGGLAWLQTGVSIERLGGGELLTVEGDPRTHGRPIVPSVALDDALAGVFPKQTLHGQIMVDVASGEVVRQGDHGPERWQPPKRPPPGERPKNSFYPAHEFPEHMWGLTVDLDRCIGCGACVVACQAENNVAWVGPEGIQLGREMHWLRIERYWVESAAGALDGPRPRFIPIMCQHCENAPCEPVCPVFAAYHTRDGLNAQIYNRCVGTRYCANNCPYKVRRFNWFDYAWPEPLEQQLNPDVVVRSAGVMEKCTMCVQRIREKWNRAKAEGRALAEGEIVPACAQTCPTGAIRFGDRKDDAAAVVRLAADGRAYRLLDYYLNVKPAVSYLCKVDRGPRPGRREG